MQIFNSQIVNIACSVCIGMLEISLRCTGVFALTNPIVIGGKIKKIVLIALIALILNSKSYKEIREVQKSVLYSNWLPALCL